MPTPGPVRRRAAADRVGGVSSAAPQQIPAPEYELPEGFTHVYSGKVRDLYETPEGRLLFVASDRISAYDWVLPTPIPDKGRILTAMSLWWFDQLERPRAQPRPLHRACPTPVGRPRDGLRASSRCSRSSASPAATSPAPGLTEYQRERLGLRRPAAAGARGRLELPEPIFTPATKAELGEHDENVTFDEVVATDRRRTRRSTLREPHPGGLRAGRGDRRRARHHPRRHQVRVRRAAPTARSSSPTRC